MNEANSRYYNHEMKTRRVRVVFDVDVEWREDDPDYSLQVARTDALPETSVRVMHPKFVSAEFVQ